MTVQELIAYLEDCDPEAQVKTMQQQSWPFEYSIAGIARRETFEEMDSEQDGPVKNFQDHTDQPEANDVFIMEGSQLRYGNKSSWENME